MNTLTELFGLIAIIVQTVTSFRINEFISYADLVIIFMIFSILIPFVFSAFRGTSK